jgi:UPF0755 protein
MKKIFTITVFAFLIVSLMNSCNKVEKQSQNIPSSETETTQSNTVTVTFPEGLTLRDIADKLEENSVCSSAEFIEEAAKPEYIEQYGFLITDREKRFYPLEGYIFPDTYEFFKNENVSSVLKKFLRNTSSKLNDDIKSQADKLGLTLDELITFASIVQKESGGSAEAGKVASVLHNRLNNPSFLKLQCDACSLYLKKYIKPYTDETSYDTYCEDYNTYMIKGLPVGAICNPGMASINAVLNPEDTDYYFFVTDSDNIYHYAETWEEHQSNVREAGLG